MQHFVLKDINPEKVTNFEPFLKEMNDITVLLSVAAAPHVSSKYLEVDDQTGIFSFQLSENQFQVKFKGKKENQKIVSGYFEVFEDGVRIVEISYTIGEVQPVAMRVKLNCEGELMAKSELERAFQRDFSHEAHKAMKTSLDELRKPIEEVKEVVEQADQTSSSPIDFEENEALIEAFKEKKEVQEEEVEEEMIGEDVTEELQTLTEKVMNSIKEVRDIIRSLNHTCHDLTRGATIDFSNIELRSQQLENGATVEMLDEEANGYKITFRKGSLDSMSEVSFFLEKEDDLIFSVYLSSAGNGKITAPENQSHIVFKKVKYHLL